MRVLFTETRRTEATPPELFEAGQVYDLSPASAARWKSRGFAVDAPPVVEELPAAEPEAPAAVVTEPEAPPAPWPADTAEAAAEDAVQAAPEGDDAAEAAPQLETTPGKASGKGRRSR